MGDDKLRPGMMAALGLLIAIGPLACLWRADHLPNPATPRNRRCDWAAYSQWAAPVMMLLCQTGPPAQEALRRDLGQPPVGLRRVRQRCADGWEYKLPRPGQQCKSGMACQRALVHKIEQLRDKW